jgi:cysteinyl-tRNA synthetase
LRDIYKKFHPETLRLFLISSHYRSPIDFSLKNLEDAEKVILRFYETLERAELLVENNYIAVEQVKNNPFLVKCEKAMNNDFNTAVVVAHLNEESRGINSECINIDGGAGDKASLAVRLEAFKVAGGLLGLLTSSLKEIKQKIFNIKQVELEIDVEKIECLINDRNQARKEKQWARADECRDKLVRMGVLLEDTSQGTKWKIK